MGNHVDAARLLDQGDLSGAVAAIERVLGAPPGDRERADALAVAGRIYLAANHPERAEEYLRESVRLCEEMEIPGPRAWYYLGLSLRRQDRFTEALEAYRRSARDAEVAGVADVKVAALQNAAGAACKAGLAPVALQLLAEANRHCSTDEDALYQRIGEAEAYMAAGQYPEALRVAGALVSKPGIPGSVAEQANQLYKQAQAHIA